MGVGLEDIVSIDIHVILKKGLEHQRRNQGGDSKYCNFSWGRGSQGPLMQSAPCESIQVDFHLLSASGNDRVVSACSRTLYSSQVPRGQVMSVVKVTFDGST